MSLLKEILEALNTLLGSASDPAKRETLREYGTRLRPWLKSANGSLLLAGLVAALILLIFTLLFSNPTTIIIQWVIKALAALLCGLLFWVFYRWSGKLLLGLGVGALGMAAVIALVYLAPPARLAFDGFPTATPAAASTAVLAAAQPEVVAPAPTATVQPPAQPTTVSSASRDAAVVSISFRVNDQDSRVVDLRSADTQGIRVLPGDRLALEALWFQNSGEQVEGATINAEIYAGEQKIGRFEGVPFQKGIHPLGKFVPTSQAAETDPGAWLVPADWAEMRVILLVYKPGQPVERRRVDIQLAPDGDTGLMVLAPGSMKISERDGTVLIYIPAGEFTMGSDASDPWAESDEKPQRKVTLEAYWIGKTEVTNAMYALCVQSKDCVASSSGDFADPRYRTYPVMVNWEQAQTYCAWAGGRLPSEAEWEKAARGTDARIFPWGNAPVSASLVNSADKNAAQVENVTWAALDIDDGYTYMAPVGNYPEGASPYGLLDAAGNIWEWTADWYSPDYYASGPDQNPPGPTAGAERVLRGGSWYDDTKNVRVANRYSNKPTDSKGLRCVMDE